MKRLLLATGTISALLLGTVAQAGPFILSGTDSDDHGSFNGSVNVGGWLYMQKALENVASGVTTGNKVVTVLGSGNGTQAGNAAASAFNHSSLVGAGWTLNVVSTANFATFFGAGGNLGTGILLMDSGSNVSGGVDDSFFNPYATAIDNFLDNGGGLFSQANGFSWLNVLLPTVTFTDLGGGGNGATLALTPGGNAAFPGLTNADLSSGPWHGYFNNIGSLTDLANASDGTHNVIIGGASGSITAPVEAPEPGSLALMGLALAGMAGVRARRKTA